jgi:hypothetical protein
MFDRLKELNSDSSSLNKQHTLSSFLNYRMDPWKSILDGYLEIEELSRSLNEMSVLRNVTYVNYVRKDWSTNRQCKRGHRTAQMVEHLPMRLKFKREEEVFIHPNIKNVRQYLPHLDLGQEMESLDPTVSPLQNVNNTNCNNCGKKGHWLKECRSEPQTPICWEEKLCCETGNPCIYVR